MDLQLATLLLPTIQRIIWQSAPTEENAIETLVNANVTRILRVLRVRGLCARMTAQDEDDACPLRHWQDYRVSKFGTYDRISS